jgi:hypothetical protein
VIADHSQDDVLARYRQIRELALEAGAESVMPHIDVAVESYHRAQVHLSAIADSQGLRELISPYAKSRTPIGDVLPLLDPADRAEVESIIALHAPNRWLECPCNRFGKTQQEFDDDHH